MDICCLIFLTLRILYTDSTWVLSAVTIFMAISGALSEVLTYYGWQIFVQKSEVRVNVENEEYLLMLISKLVMFFFINILLARIKRHKNIKLNIAEWVQIFVIPVGSIVILVEIICHKESMSETLDFVAVLMVMLINILHIICMTRSERQQKNGYGKRFCRNKVNIISDSTMKTWICG